MTTKTIVRTFSPPGGSLNIELYGGTLRNDSSSPITVEGATLAAGATIALSQGDSSVSVLCTQQAQVTVAYTSNEAQANSIGSVSIGSPVQIGTNAIGLGSVWLLSSTARTYGGTWIDENEADIGDSFDLPVNAPGSSAVQLPTPPPGAVKVALVPPIIATDSTTIYYVSTTDQAKVTNFQNNYGRYRRKLITSTGGSLGA